MAIHRRPGKAIDSLVEHHPDRMCNSGASAGIESFQPQREPPDVLSEGGRQKLVHGLAWGESPIAAVSTGPSGIARRASMRTILAR